MSGLRLRDGLACLFTVVQGENRKRENREGGLDEALSTQPAQNCGVEHTWA